MVPPFLVSPAKNPIYPSLAASRFDAIAAYLASRNFLQPHERLIDLAPAGRASRNETLRVATNERTFVVKRFLEWPGEGPSAPSAESRFAAEGGFNRAARIAGCAGGHLPIVLHHDRRERCIVFSDLGRGRPGSAAPSAAEVESVAWALVGLHHHSQSVPAHARHDNGGLRQWLAARLFADGPWIARLAAGGAVVRERLAEARIAVAEEGACLVHGDFAPENWIVDGGRIAIVDAEGSFFGRPEIDAGSMLAGLLFAGVDDGALGAAVGVLAGGCVRYDARLVTAFAGVHLCRRIEAARASGGRLPGAVARAKVGRVVRAIASGTWAGLLETRPGR